MVLAFLASLACGVMPAEAQLTWEKNDFEISLSGRVVGEVALGTDPLGPGEGFTFWTEPKPLRQRRLASISGRQTGLSLTVLGPALGSLTPLVVVDVNLMGADPGAQAPGAYFQRAFVELSNEDWAFRFGRFGAVVAPLAASTINWPGLGQGGDLNTGGPRDLFLVERRFRPAASWGVTLQAAISNPENNFMIDVPNRTSENDGVPNFESRIAAGIGVEQPDGTRPFEIGLSALAGRLRAENLQQRISDDVWAGAIDVAYRGGRFTFLGEMWKGKALGSYDGAIGQTGSDTSTELIRAEGFWGQVLLELSRKWTLGAGYGLDNPEEDQLASGMRSRNEVFLANLMFKPDPAFEIGYEVRHYSTEYKAPTMGNNVLIHQLLTRYTF